MALCLVSQSVPGQKCRYTRCCSYQPTVFIWPSVLPHYFRPGLYQCTIQYYPQFPIRFILCCAWSPSASAIIKQCFCRPEPGLEVYSLWLYCCNETLMKRRGTLTREEV